MDLQIGSKIGEYTLESYLGGGSFGAVWRARNEAGETVAVKVLTGALSNADSSRRRAEVEMLAAAAVASRSEHVVRVLGSGDDPLPYIVMEYVDGGDLSSMLKDAGVLPVGRAIDVGVAIMDALSALNDAGIFHRDIKPANVMIDQKGVIKLADFGIAKIVGYESITMTGQAAMTMAYAAPEVWDEDGSFGRPSHRSDLYAAGIVLYQCLVGATPFKGNYGALYKAHAEHSPELTLLPAATPPSLRTLVERCLEKRQADRPADANACLTMLRRASVELRERAGPLAGEPSRFGSWRKEAQHPTQPWAWRCVNETSGETAVLELHFVDKLEQGAELRRIVEVNERITGLGAERLIGTSRALLGPGESWQAPPPGQFQFWVAREDKMPAPARSVGPDALTTSVRTLNALMEACERQQVSISLKDTLTVAQDGSIYLSRPGLVVADEYTAARALATLKALPLSPEARELVESARDFQALVRLAGEDDDMSTRVVSPAPVVTATPVADQTIVLAGAVAAAAAIPEAAPAPPPPAPRVETAAPIQMLLRQKDPKAAPGQYELLLTNPSPTPAAIRLGASSWKDTLRVELPEVVNVAAGLTQSVNLAIAARKKRWFGGKRRTGFTIVASNDGGGANRPPVSLDGEFEDDASRAPLFAGGSVLGVAAIVAIAAIALSSGGGKASPQLAADNTATATAVATSTATATETPIPPTVTPEPPTATSVPAPVAPPPAAPTSTPRPVVVPPTPVPAAPTIAAPVYVPPTAVPIPPSPTVQPTLTPIPPPTAVPTCPADQALNVEVVGPNIANIQGSAVCHRTVNP